MVQEKEGEMHSAIVPPMSAESDSSDESGSSAESDSENDDPLEKNLHMASEMDSQPAIEEPKVQIYRV